MLQHFQLIPSRYLFIWLCVVHGLAAAALYSLPLSLALSGLVFGGLVLHFGWLVRHLAHPEYAGIQFSEGRFFLLKKDGSRQEASVLSSTVVMPYWIVLHVSVAGRRTHLPLLSDSLSDGANGFRQLKVRLRWG